MKYTILFLCLDDEKLNIQHQTNDYDQAEHFYWAMILKLKAAHERIDTHSWQLTLSFKNEKDEDTFKYHFSKT